MCPGPGIHRDLDDGGDPGNAVGEVAELVGDDRLWPVRALTPSPERVDRGVPVGEMGSRLSAMSDSRSACSDTT